MAIILNLETATTNCSVGIAQDGKLVVLKEYDSVNYSHSEQLHTFIIEVLKEGALTIDELNAIAVSKGPGSYTGLRIGVSAAKGLCFSLDIPLISVATLESMAHQMQVDKMEVIIPVLDARRMEVYAAVFDANYDRLQETKAEIIDTNSFKEWARDRRVHLIGSGAEKCKVHLTSPNFNFNTTLVPSAREMCMLSYKKFIAGDFEDVAYFEPYYLKDFMLSQKK